VNNFWSKFKFNFEFEFKFKFKLVLFHYKTGSKAIFERVQSSLWSAETDLSTNSLSFLRLESPVANVDDFLDEFDNKYWLHHTIAIKSLGRTDVRVVFLWLFSHLDT
jgi:hypothetical protein